MRGQLLVGVAQTQTTGGSQLGGRSDLQGGHVFRSSYRYERPLGGTMRASGCSGGENRGGQSVAALRFRGLGAWLVALGSVVAPIDQNGRARRTCRKISARILFSLVQTRRDRPR